MTGLRAEAYSATPDAGYGLAGFTALLLRTPEPIVSTPVSPDDWSWPAMEIAKQTQRLASGGDVSRMSAWRAGVRGM
jgi:hypothetical protein